MKFKFIYLILLLLALSNNDCNAFHLMNGNYAAGFKSYNVSDVTRPYLLNKDTIPRPLLIHFWYPSREEPKSESYYFKNYIDLIAIRENFYKPSSEVENHSYNFVNAYAEFAKQQFGLDSTITTQQILDCQVTAKRGVALAEADEHFPLIIYAPSNSKSSVQNHIICEYLASHGFMIISVGSAGENSIVWENDQTGIMAQVNDMEYILNYFEDSLRMEYSGLGLFGFSTGGLATSIFQMRNEKVDAVFSMDGSQEYVSYISLFNLEDFNLEKANVPYCAMVNNFENFSFYPYFNSMVSKEKYILKSNSGIKLHKK